ncbi:unnamed protein product [Coffea canephora]|uniref:Uncharacterized protein n=1 Tax=Coffea canephora TaxID=49390 RepID=A0A068U4Y9_COFCA|nr:unnamed protein product [Coffea canephora]
MLPDRIADWTSMLPLANPIFVEIDGSQLDAWRPSAKCKTACGPVNWGPTLLTISNADYPLKNEELLTMHQLQFFPLN